MGNLRKPKLLPPIEFRAGIVQFVTSQLSASTDECETGIARMLSFKKTSQQLSQTIESKSSSASRLATVRAQQPALCAASV